MQLARRGFLRWLGGLAGAAVAAPLLTSTDWLSTEPLIALPGVATKAPALSVGWMTAEVVRRTENRLNRSFHFTTDDMVGKGPLRSQFMIAIPPIPSEDIISPHDFSRKHLEPVAAALASRISRERWTTFGQLELPTGVLEAHRWKSEGSGVSVRGVSQYDVMNDWQMVRFDVLGG